jgi:hypothetical protein
MYISSSADDDYEYGNNNMQFQAIRILIGVGFNHMALVVNPQRSCPWIKVVCH